MVGEKSVLTSIKYFLWSYWRGSTIVRSFTLSYCCVVKSMDSQKSEISETVPFFFFFFLLL